MRNARLDPFITIHIVVVGVGHLGKIVIVSRMNY
jgi:hypothetical protein